MSSVLNYVNPVKTLGILLVPKITCRPQNAKETEIYVYQYNKTSWEEQILSSEMVSFIKHAQRGIPKRE